MVHIDVILKARHFHVKLSGLQLSLYCCLPRYDSRSFASIYDETISNVL